MDAHASEQVTVSSTAVTGDCSLLLKLLDKLAVLIGKVFGKGRVVVCCLCLLVKREFLHFSRHRQAARAPAIGHPLMQ